MGHKRAKHAFELPDIVNNISSDILQHIFRQNHTFAVGVLTQHVTTQKQVRTFERNRHTPFETAEKPVFDPLHFRRRTVG